MTGIAFWFGINDRFPLLVFFFVLLLHLLAIIYATIKKGFAGFFLAFFFPIIGTIIVSFLSSNDEKKKNKTFYCGICCITYREEMLAGKTDYEGLICKYCLEKKHKEKT